MALQMRMEPKSEAPVSQNPCSLLWFISSPNYRVYNPQLECVNHVKMGSYYFGSVVFYFKIKHYYGRMGFKVRLVL